jgi:hypothetical protein
MSNGDYSMLYFLIKMLKNLYYTATTFASHVEVGRREKCMEDKKSRYNSGKMTVVHLDQNNNLP